MRTNNQGVILHDKGTCTDDRGEDSNSRREPELGAQGRIIEGFHDQGESYHDKTPDGQGTSLNDTDRGDPSEDGNAEGTNNTDRGQEHAVGRPRRR